MNIASVKPRMKVYHEGYGICKVVRKSGSRVIIERSVKPFKSHLNVGDDNFDEDDDEEDSFNDDTEVSVRAEDLILESEMSPALRVHATEKQAKEEAIRKAKEEQEAQWIIWKASLPELPKKVHNHLKGCCKDGMMAFLVFLNTDPDALDKLRQHSLFLLREAVDSVSKEVPTLEQDLLAKKEFLDMIESIKSKPKKGVKLAQTA